MKILLYYLVFSTIFFTSTHISQAQTEETVKTSIKANKYGIMKIIDNDVSLFEKPHGGMRQLATIPINTIVKFKGKNYNRWSNIQMFNGGPAGWVESKSVEYCPESDTDGALIPPSISILNPDSATMELNFLQHPNVSELESFRYGAKYFRLDGEVIVPVDTTESLGFYINKKYAVAVPDLNKIYVNAGGITVLSTKDFQVLKTIDIKKDYFSVSRSTEGAPPHPDLVALSSNNLIFLTSREYSNSYLYIVDPKFDKLVNYIAKMPAIGSVTASANGKIYITCPWVRQLVVIDAVKQKVQNRINVPEGPVGVLSYKNRLYLTTLEGSLIIFDVVTDKIIKQLQVGPSPSELWLGEDEKIYVLNTANYYRD